MIHNQMYMKNFFSKSFRLILIFTLAFGVISCASKHYQKLALKNEQAGLYEDAAELYLQSLAANKNNIEAKIGAKKNGQIALDRKLSDFSKAYAAGQSRNAVFFYIAAKNYKEKFDGNGISLDFPQSYEEQFGEVKNLNIEENYREGVKLLSEEKFAESETLFKEIIYLDGKYKDVNDLYRTAHYEPLYRQGKKLYENKTYRKSYYIFTSIVNETGGYKESEQYKSDALEAATFTVLVKEFDYKFDAKLASRIRSAMIARMINSENPFLKIVDESYDRDIQREQQKVFDGKVNINSDIQLGKVLTNNAVLKGKIIQAGGTTGNLNSYERKGFLKKTFEVKDKTTGVVTTKVEYDKVKYKEFVQTNSVICVFAYQLIATETGEILVSDEINLTNEDQMNFASYESEYKNVYPGYWERQQTDSDKDAVNTSYSDYSKLQSLFSAKRTIKSVEQMMGEVVDQIALKSSSSIIRYNPEK